MKFQVQDTGIGIAPEKHAAVLDAFTQADASTTRRFGGTGLGLAISKQLIELMGGQLKLESEPGVGTSFCFTIPVEPGDETEDLKDQLLADLKGLRVLVVDDNATNRRILDEILRAWQLQPTLTDGGEAALAAIKKADQSNASFQLAILDCMMPEMDGYELASQIRRLHDDNDLRLIILSSATRPDDETRCEQMKIARFMTKPVVQSEMLEMVLQVMCPESMPPESSEEDEAVDC
ncbi:MAG: response regulator, partial [Pirellulaceae bacterium]|nr:response regulator [Pirellulaceae bacterium]